MSDPLRNPKDPLRKTGPDHALELFRAMSRAGNGFAPDDVINAAANVLIAALRQSNAQRGQAERQFDELFGRCKSVLLNHYDGVTGRRRGVFPFDQVIRPEFVTSKSRIN